MENWYFAARQKNRSLSGRKKIWARKITAGWAIKKANFGVEGGRMPSKLFDG